MGVRNIPGENRDVEEENKGKQGNERDEGVNGEREKRSRRIPIPHTGLF